MRYEPLLSIAMLNGQSAIIVCIPSLVWEDAHLGKKTGYELFANWDAPPVAWFRQVFLKCLGHQKLR
jgi:hypothetical protein